MASSLRPSLKSGLSTSYAGSQTEHHDHLSSDVQLLPLNRHKSQQDIVYTEESINEKGKRKSVLFTVLLLLTTLLLGIGLSFGHDAFYRYLDTREVNDVIISQTWVNRVGTALAFLVKTSLVACVTTAYVQLFWYKARNRSFALAKIDTLFALPADPWSFHDLALLLRVPDLLLLGLAMWCLPIAAVVAPGTLLVVSRPIVDTVQSKIPQPFYNSTAWAVSQKTNADFAFAGSTTDVLKTATAAAVTDQVLDIPHDFPNMTYSQDFFGPAIQCTNMNSSVNERASTMFEGFTGSWGAFTYWSWTGNDDHGLLSGNSSLFSITDVWAYLDLTSKDAARIHFVTLNPSGINYTATECLLYNASYSIELSFADDALKKIGRTVTPKAKLPSLNAPVIYYNETVTTPWYLTTQGERTSFQAVMQAFGRLLTGYGSAGSMSQSASGISSYQLTSVNWTDTPSMQDNLEMLFQNMTISMLANSALVYNSTLAPVVPVKVTTYPIVYSYERVDLWYAYGPSLFITFLIAATGIYAIHVNQASYSNSFTTIARVSKNAGLERLIPVHDDGANPLPKQLGKARVHMHRSTGTN